MKRNQRYFADNLYMLILCRSRFNKNRKTNQNHRELKVLKTPKLLLNKRFLLPILIFFLPFLFFQKSAASDEPKDKVSVVVLDAGHGGPVPGAVTKNAKEKDIVLAITLKAGEYIEKNIPEVEVIYTRKTDINIPLHERANIANKNEADLFISIHANWGSSSRAVGTETFIMGPSADARNRQVAMKENSVITFEEDYTTNYEGFDPNSAESYIIFNLMQKTYLQQSAQFAELVEDQFRDRAGRRSRGVKQDVFLVLWRTTMPSVLIETGFLTNPAEEKYLMSKQGQEYIASAIFRAFRDYKASIENKSHYTKAAAPETRDEDIRPAAVLTRATDAGTGNDGNIYYMIQVLTTSRVRPLDHESFSNYGHVSEFKMNNLYKYAVGKSTSYSQVSSDLSQVQEDFPGAFIIAVKEGRIIPVSEVPKQNN